MSSQSKLACSPTGKHSVRPEFSSAGAIDYTSLMRSALLTVMLLLPATARAQWEIQDSHTTASLRGIHALGNGIAWASGSAGTVLRTIDDGKTWQLCATPPNAEKLDFRGIQAFDASTAIVMSSGKGDLSRLYKTTDACRTWTLLFTNPDPEGFWDAMKFQDKATSNRFDGKVFRSGSIFGDPVDGQFVEFATNDNGMTWRKMAGPFFPAFARPSEALFAASNSSAIFTDDYGEMFVTGGVPGSRSRIRSEYVKYDPQVSVKFVGGDIPLSKGESAGAFSVATSYVADPTRVVPEKNRIYDFPPSATCVAVGGDYKKPDQSSGTAARSRNGCLHWRASTTPPHGYRSSVAYSSTTKTWITVGPNGTDISTDDGRNWRGPPPPPTEPPDADRNWNALSLPFVVGPHGRIGKLRPDALSQTKQ
jgi:hypothetical protein